MRKFKYLAVFALPLTTYYALTGYGWVSYLPLIVFFGFVPLLELFFPPDKRNLNEQERILAQKDRFYDVLLYLTVPIQWATLTFFLFQTQESSLDYTTLIGRTISMGLMCGVIGINVGHELGHRSPGWDHLMGEILMLSSLENHFIPYHNNGHHLNVATHSDPATARKNESVYLFWFRSHFGSYFQAWRLEQHRLRRQAIHWFSWKNKMIKYTLAQIILLITIYFAFDLRAVLFFLTASIFGILLLETVNYIEHYGLLRKQKKNGRYERVQHHHSWNSDYVIGRVVLFELSRHSDHHYKANKHYQLLDSLDTSPQMPTGYPGMMVFALFPPLWFRYMNKQIQVFHSKQNLT
ncbi:MAG: alkane 1-monooxygenase [Flavobacteriales bacterium]|nr:alkane 1-monooxygenase [Flavobacteriales bacterium]